MFCLINCHFIYFIKKYNDFTCGKVLPTQFYIPDNIIEYYNWCNLRNEGYHHEHCVRVLMLKWTLEITA